MRLSVSLLLATFPTLILAETSTQDIVSSTVSAAVSCASWKPSGACFWLKCSLWKCSVKTSLRITHFNPDVVVSTYHDKETHPWSDYGASLAEAVGKLQGSLLGGLFDSAGTTTSEDRRERGRMYRDADAIGNPLATLNFLFGGGSPNPQAPSNVQIPGGDNVTLSNNTSGNGNSSPGGSQSGSGNSGQSGNSGGGSGNGGMSFICPTPVTPFYPYYLSGVDALAWRAYLPVEALYPASLIPGQREVGNWPSNTWGPLFPRDGHVIQQHPVKAAAVLSSRVADFTTRQNQGHVYEMLPTGGIRMIGNYRVWLPPAVKENDGSTGKWQMLAPKADSSCQVFGKNDTLELSSWGDGKTDKNEAYAFNLWRPYSCCSKAGQAFLGAVTF